jgi:hypothetical protein
MRSHDKRGSGGICIGQLDIARKNQSDSTKRRPSSIKPKATLRLAFSETGTKS